MDFYHSRRTQLLRGAKADEVDAYLVTDPNNVRYLTGFDTAAAVLVSGKGTSALFPGDAIPPKKQLPSDCTPVPQLDDHDPTAALVELIRSASVKSVGVEAGHLTVAALHRMVEGVGKTPLRPLTGRVEDLRQFKDPSEVDEVKKAVGVAGRALLMFRTTLREIDTEVDLVRQMDALVLRAGANTVAFPSVVALGESAGLSHFRPTADRPLAEVSKVFVHWGAKLDYCGVMARTFRSPFGAPPLRKNKQERTGQPFEKVSEAVRDAMAAAVDAIRPNATAGDVAKAAHTKLAAAGLAKFAGDEVGHGVGLAPREGPFLRTSEATPLESGMVLNITPQVRIPDWGIMKYSKMVAVNREGCTALGGGPRVDD